MPKCSKTDTTQEEQNSDEEDCNNDNNDNNKPKKAPVKGRGKGKGPARGKKIRCVAWPSPPAFANYPTHHFIEKLLPSRQLRMRLRMQKACLPISSCQPSSPPNKFCLFTGLNTYLKKLVHLWHPPSMLLPPPPLSSHLHLLSPAAACILCVSLRSLHQQWRGVMRNIKTRTPKPMPTTTSMLMMITTTTTTALPFTSLLLATIRKKRTLLPLPLMVTIYIYYYFMYLSDVNYIFSP